MSTTPTSRDCRSRRENRGAALLILALLAGGCSGSGGPAKCRPGELGCACQADDTCDALLTCAANVCQPCADGKLGCPCAAGDRCEEKLACSGGLCARCREGTAGCACGAGGSCEGSLACRNGYCVDPAGCPEGTLDCPCGSGGSCDSGLACSVGTCRTCNGDLPGCPCLGGACQGLVCDTGRNVCRAALRCDEAGCAAQQRCAPGGTGRDASCLADCYPGFTWNAAAHTCEPIAGSHCGTTAGSIVLACAQEHRDCVAGNGSAQCGDCLSGYLPEGGICRAVITCEALGCAAAHRSCTPPGEHADGACGGCQPGYVSSNGQCLPDPSQSCSAIQATCEARNMLCAETSSGPVCQGCLTGFIYDAAQDQCRRPYTCDTLPVRCSSLLQECRPGTASTDASCYVPCPPCNGPGEEGVWPELTRYGKCMCRTSSGYFYTLSGASGTYPCDADNDGWTRDTARFSLESDDPAIRVNARCALRRVDRFVLHDEQGQMNEVALAEPLPLYETVRNDDQALLDAVVGTGAVPIYGTGGRALRAAELNSLTKACAGDKADFNQNGLNDVSEYAGQALSGAVPSGLGAQFEVYTRFSYFLELHRGRFTAGMNGLPGAYHIREKDRRLVAADNFPLRYGVEEGTTPPLRTSDYWQACPRARDGWYQEGAPAVTMDFTWVRGSNPSWNGMLHHSQFKCVQFVDEVAYRNAGSNRSANRHLQTTAPGLGPRGTLGEPPASLPAGMARADYLRATPNRCTAQSGWRADLAGNPQDPVIRCQALPRDEVQVGEVLWVATRIVESSQYDRGCILQCNGHPYLCGGSDPNASAPQSCYYVCGDLAASETGTLTDSQNRYRLRGEVPVVPMDDSTLGNQTNTYQILPPALP